MLWATHNVGGHDSLGPGYQTGFLTFAYLLGLCLFLDQGQLDVVSSFLFGGNDRELLQKLLRQVVCLPANQTIPLRVALSFWLLLLTPILTICFYLFI